jgi:hypothetical protein
MNEISKLYWLLLTNEVPIEKDKVLLQVPSEGEEVLGLLGLLEINYYAANKVSPSIIYGLARNLGNILKKKVISGSLFYAILLPVLPVFFQNVMFTHLRPTDELTSPQVFQKGLVLWIWVLSLANLGIFTTSKILSLAYDISYNVGRKFLDYVYPW